MNNLVECRPSNPERIRTGPQPAASRGAGGFSLVEVVISVCIITLVFAGIIQGNVQSAKRAEWSGYSLAASALANQQLEQCRSALWDNGIFPPTNQLSALTHLVGWTYSTNTLVGTGHQLCRRTHDQSQQCDQSPCQSPNGPGGHGLAVQSIHRAPLFHQPHGHLSRA
jgi:Tfp pilus assembly protein PilV